MRYPAILLLCLTLSSAPAQEATPVKQPADSQPFKPVLYSNPETHATLTLTGPDTLAYVIDGHKRTGKYTLEEKKMHVVLDPDAQSGKPGAVHIDYIIPMEGMLVNPDDPEQKDVYANEAALKKIKIKQLETICLSNEKQIALACKLYASDHGGSYPVKLEELIPTYLQDASIFISPLSAKKEAIGYDYYSGLDSDPPDKILLRSKDTTPDGKRVIVHSDCSGVIEADK
jgi:hypothetical protein